MARTPKTAATHPVTTKLIAGYIQPIISWCDEELGRRAEFLEAFRAHIAPELVTRQVVEGWISTNPEKRTEPMFGSGLAMIETARKLGIYPNETPNA